MTSSRDLLRTAQSIVDRAHTKGLCQTCWAVVPMEGEHVCDPVTRAAAMVRATGLHFTDPHKRAKGYGVG